MSPLERDNFNTDFPVKVSPFPVTVYFAETEHIVKRVKLLYTTNKLITLTQIMKGTFK